MNSENKVVCNFRVQKWLAVINRLSKWVEWLGWNDESSQQAKEDCRVIICRALGWFGDVSQVSQDIWCLIEVDNLFEVGERSHNK